MKRIMVLEDKENYREKIRKIIDSLEVTTYAVYATSTGKAYEIIENNDIDLFLVDIILKPENPGDMSGLNFIENVRHMEQYKYTPVIFITELEDPKLYAYRELKCYGYIQKPFEAEDLLKELQNALELPASRTSKSHIYFRNDGVIYSVNSDDIVYIENIKRKLFIYTTTERLTMSYETAKKFMEKINDGRFVRCSRYTIVNIDYIQRVDLANRFIQMKGIEKNLEIGVSTKDKFKDELSHRGTVLN